MQINNPNDQQFHTIILNHHMWEIGFAYLI